MEWKLIWSHKVYHCRSYDMSNVVSLRMRQIDKWAKRRKIEKIWFYSTFRHTFPKDKSINCTHPPQKRRKSRKFSTFWKLYDWSDHMMCDYLQNEWQNISSKKIFFSSLLLAYTERFGVSFTWHKTFTHIHTHRHRRMSLAMVRTSKYRLNVVNALWGYVRS